MYPKFFQYVTSYEVFVLLETHICEDKIEQGKKYFKDYDTYWKPAIRNSRFGRALGGCVYGVKKELTRIGIHHLFTSENGVDTIKVNGNGIIFTVVPAYIRGANWRDEFALVRNYFLDKDIVNPMLIGDLNVRIGELQQNLDDVIKSSFAAGMGIRRSNDLTVNGIGREFMDFCTDNGLVVLNGYTKGDEEGNHTFISNVGSSVNDICSVSQECLFYIKEFVVDKQLWSDHMPIQLSLYLSSMHNSERKLNLLPKLQWKDDNKNAYQSKLNENLTIIQNKEVLQLKDLSEVIKISVVGPKNYGKCLESKNRWYGWKCEVARKKSFQWLNIYRRSKNQDDREKYLQANHKYKVVCQENIRQYYQEIDRKINLVTDSKEWWRLVKEIRNQEFQKGSDISAMEFKNYFQLLLNPPQTALDTHYAPCLYENEELDKAITIAEVKQVLCKVKLNKAPGEDRIPYEFLINATDKFLDKLTTVYDAILNKGVADDTFTTSIVFPVFKKGDVNQPCNYRGISFMNSIAKVMMGVLNERLYSWVEKYKVLTEYQAGFRRQYSTVDNIYNLASIVHIKFAEKKKLYAFFIDFKAAFDKVSRKALIYKLHLMGVSTKFVNLIGNIYNNTKSAVWTGEEISEHFETRSGVKQGCLLSPLLFALYLNDLHDYLGGGINLGTLNIRLLMYADDIVIMADDIKVMQTMVNRIEKYCDKWNLEVNLEKSEMMVFRRGGRLSKEEKWIFKGEPIRTVSEYCYLGILLTPKMGFEKHVDRRTDSAKNSINATWQNFLRKTNITLRPKWKLFQAACKTIQAYGAQVWGYGFFEKVDKLQRYFIKRILKLPDCTPNYAITIETGLEDNHFYTLDIHLRYIMKTMFEYSEQRLPHQLTKIILQKNLFCFKELNILGERLDLKWKADNVSQSEWNIKRTHLITQLKISVYQEKLQRALASSTRIYKHLDHTIGNTYFIDRYDQRKITWIFKARCDLIPLNGNRYQINESKLCSLCNLREEETMQHFLGKCPILQEFRYRYFGKTRMLEEEVIQALNGIYDDNWEKLTNYIIGAFTYRKSLINEFNN